MLGTCVRAKVVKTIGESSDDGYVFSLNYAKIYDTPEDEYTFIMGVTHPVSNFDGRIVARLNYKRKRDGKPMHVWVMAPKSQKYIINIDIIEALNLEELIPKKNYELICYYEQSAGALTYRMVDNFPVYLLIKNRGSNNWGFPKGHLEKGETRADAARREVFEETGITVKLHIGYEGVSKYTIRECCQKKVSIFVGRTDEIWITPQYKEIQKFGWFTYTEAMKALSFKNDRRILAQAHEYLYKIGVLVHTEEEYIKRSQRIQEMIKQHRLECEAKGIPMDKPRRKPKKRKIPNYMRAEKKPDETTEKEENPNAFNIDALMEAINRSSNKNNADNNN
ncbi:MAG: NUDIX domain-containing protein [Acetobacter sp.]|nr:NUDIX domain-containing protein [Bacteroides sp.]MCM1340410.1 NUDIX domain-containing protein [Acetobacter sp.]MCM1432943.1 NUDIX domain-containing protein [Clostridiales bacterium]